ncbi:hypothetical protein G9A89_010044 [Geosiphon pyriformis]|nr:hypothetical protein G9A89_010044 [Geosiphon pyriformis]
METKLRLSIRPWIKDKFNGVQIFTSGFDEGFLETGIAIIMNNSLAWHVSKVEKVPGHVISVYLFFKGKISVLIVGLYAGASFGIRFGLASVINFFLAYVVNTSSFVVLGGNFNKDGSKKKSASFGFCSSLGLVNFFGSHSLVGVPTWIMAGRKVEFVSEFFDTNHLAVLVSVGLGSLLHIHISSVHKQANRDQWKFKLKSVDDVKWNHFKKCFSKKFMIRMVEFADMKHSSDLNAMWEILKEAVVDSADATFSRLWFNEFNYIRNKLSSRFYRLELLMSKITKNLSLGLHSEKAFKICFMIDDRIVAMDVLYHISVVKRRYQQSKYYESKVARDNSIKNAVKKCMENFCSDKRKMIKSILDQFFRKIVLDYLIVDDKLILKPLEIKTSIDTIMEGWTRKCLGFSVSAGHWSNQYASLSCVNNKAFLGVIDTINMSEFLWVKHGALIIFDGLLWVFNVCLATVMEGVLTNTRSITLIETAWKILSKIFSNRIFLACSNFDILHGDNFLVLRGTSTQTPIFAIGLVVDMHKAYNSVGWSHLLSSLVRIKMCSHFIKFFGSIHNNRINWVMTDFGLTNDYVVHDGLDQGEMFSLLLWRIFYDSLLCEVKKHEQLYGYRICSKFHTRSEKPDLRNALTSFFTAGAFVDDTIWIENCLTATQQILDIVSEFFSFNDISINTEKTVAILINQGICEAVLHISGLRISVAKKGEPHRYLEIFLSTNGLTKPSLTKAYNDVRFFLNVILRKAITKKQFLYLVSVVLQPIIEYRLQFSFVSKSICDKWDTLHHPEFYGLRIFEQVLTENLMANLDDGLAIGQLDAPASSLFSSPATHFVYELFSGWCYVCSHVIQPVLECMPILDMLGLDGYLNMVKLLKFYGFIFTAQMLNCYGVCFSWCAFCKWKRLDLRDPVSVWFMLLANFVEGGILVNSFCDVGFVAGHLITSGSNPVEVYTDSSVKGFGSVNACGGTATYFPDADVSISMHVHGLLSSTLVELYAIALVLECVPASSAVILSTNNQALLVTWESKCVSGVIGIGAFANIDMDKSFGVWQPDGKICLDFTSLFLAFLYSYLLKALHHCLPVTMKKRLYDPKHLSVLCIRCGMTKNSDYMFLCTHDNNAKKDLLLAARANWSVLMGASAVDGVIAYSLCNAVSSTGQKVCFKGLGG